jgi:hypothetical protein
MKTTLLIYFTLSSLLLTSGIADASDTNKWGPATNRIQLSIACGEDSNEIKTNQPFNLSFSVKNLSTNGSYFIMHSATAKHNSQFQFAIRTPSGKTRNLEFPGPYIANQVALIALVPDSVQRFQYQISDVFHPDEIGVYKVTATIDLVSTGTNRLKVISNPLSFTVTPGQWEPPPPAGPKKQRSKTVTH